MKMNNAIEKSAESALSETEGSSTALSIASSFETDVTPPNRRVVSFGDVEIHEHVMILGDHPGVTGGGPPLALDWTEQDSSVLTVDEHLQRKDESRPRNGSRWSPQCRTSYLMQEYTSLEIQSATCEARKIQEFRRFHRRAGFESLRLFVEKVGRKASKKGKGFANVEDPAAEWLRVYKETVKQGKVVSHGVTC